MGVGVPGAGLSGGSDGPALSWAVGVVGAIDEVGWRGSGGDGCGFCLSARGFRSSTADEMSRVT